MKNFLLIACMISSKILIAQNIQAPFQGGIGDGFALASSNTNAQDSCFISGFDLGDDTSICVGSEISLFANELFDATFLWSTAETTKMVTVSSAGIYFVTATLGTCNFTDSIRISFIEPIEFFVETTPTSSPIMLDGSAQIVTQDAQKYLWSSGDTTNSIKNKSNGIYSVEITDSFSCVSTIEIEILVQDCYAPYNISFNSITDTSALIKWASSVIGDYKIQYMRPNKEMEIFNLPGTDSSFVIYGYPGEKAKLKLSKICDQDTLKANKLSYTFPNLKMSALENPAFIVFPNPVKEKLHVSFSSSDMNKIQIMNLLGIIVYETILVNSNNNYFDLETEFLPNGFYILNISSDSEKHVAQFTKE